ncbi:unnamed protein product, partial [Polarella glacialis]
MAFCQALSAAMSGTQVLLSPLFIFAPWCALLLLASAALDFFLLLLQRPTGLCSPQLSAEVAASRSADIEDGAPDGQAVECKNWTWPSPETHTLGKPTHEVNTCMVCLADFVDGEL